MSDPNRVLSRQLARELTEAEVDRVNGGLHTLTACTFNAITNAKDGDASVGEC